MAARKKMPQISLRTADEKLDGIKNTTDQYGGWHDLGRYVLFAGKAYEKAGGFPPERRFNKPSLTHSNPKKMSPTTISKTKGGK